MYNIYNPVLKKPDLTVFWFLILTTNSTCIFVPQVSHRSFDIWARGRAQGEPPPLRPTSGAPTVAQKMGWTGTTRTRPWMGMPRVCGARISSRASKRPSPSTLPVAGGKSSCQMRERCTVSTLDNSQSNTKATIAWKSVPWCMHKDEKTIGSSEMCGKNSTNTTFVPLVSQLLHGGECFLSTQSSL